MSDSKKPILVFGATGQQGGSVAHALLAEGWPVRTLVRDPSSAASRALIDAGVDVRRGDFTDADAMRAAMADAHGVFSVQPSSPGGTVTDEEEVRYGIAVADLANECGVRHLIYSSGSPVGEQPTGLGHFDSKAQIEAHIRTLPITATIVRPAAFMEMLVMPGFGLDDGRFNFFNAPDQSMQLIAVQDIGRIVAPVFADPDRFGGETFEIAGDAVTGHDLQVAFSDAAGHPIVYSRFPDDVLASNPFLRRLTELLDDGRLAGHADLDALRVIDPKLLSFKSWLAGPGRDAFQRALHADGSWEYNAN